MNTNPNVKKIVCFGDSNTWGREADKGNFPANVRWTGILQNELGPEYEILEEGVSGRTTNLDDPGYIDRNGFTSLPACLRTHRPFHLLMYWLGTNDFRDYFHREPPHIATAIRESLEFVQENYPEVRILLIAPPPAFETDNPKYADYVDCERKSAELGIELEKLATELGVEFINPADEGVEADPIDGIHLSAEMHTKIGKLFAEKIRQMI